MDKKTERERITILPAATCNNPPPGSENWRTIDISEVRYMRELVSAPEEVKKEVGPPANERK